MFSDVEIADAVENGSIQIRYAFLPEGNGEWTYRNPPVSAADPQGASHFSESITRSRISLRLGPVIKPLGTARRVRRSQRFCGRRNLVDLRKCPEGWPLRPGAAFVAFTSEWFCFPDGITATILSRVSQYNNGLAITASYLDSDWQGLAKLIMVNLSGRTVRIKHGADVARLFLFMTDRASSDDTRVKEQGAHYGTSWRAILEAEGDPFPVGGHRGVRFRQETWRNLNQLAKDNIGPTLVGLVLVAIGAGAKLYSTAEQAVSVRKEVSTLERPLSGVTTMVVNARQSSAQATVPLPSDTQFQPAGPFLEALVRDGASNAGATARIVGTPTGASLLLTARLARPRATTTRLDVEWLVIP